MPVLLNLVDLDRHNWRKELSQISSVILLANLWLRDLYKHNFHIITPKLLIYCFKCSIILFCTVFSSYHTKYNFAISV